MISLLTNGKPALHRNEHRGFKENQDRFVFCKVPEFHLQCDDVYKAVLSLITIILI